MAKQYMLPLLRRLTNLRTEVATGRTRRNYGVGRESRARSSLGEDGNREAGTVDWAGEKNVCSAYACLFARMPGENATKKTGPVKKEWQVGETTTAGGARARTGRMEPS